MRRLAFLILLMATNSVYSQADVETDLVDEVPERLSPSEPPDGEGSDAALKLTDRDKALAINSLLRPYRLGHWDTVIQNVRKLLPRRSLDDVQVISDYLQQTGGVSLEKMVTQCRVRLVHSGTANLPTPTAVESLLLGRQLASMLDAEIVGLRETAIMAEPLEDPKDFAVYRDLIWDRHVHSNELQNAVQLAKQGGALMRSVDRSRANKHDKTAREELNEYDFAAYLETLAELRSEMDERALEVRVNRVNYAVDILNDDAAGTMDRFFAAYVIGVDSESLVEQIKNAQAGFKRSVLMTPDLAANLEQSLRRGKESAGDLIEKSRLLFAGLHWWRRGRYGAGTEAFGLLKSKAAMQNPNLRLALMMPKKTPIPTDPAVYSKNPVPNYQRRHLFIWAYEDRVFGKSSGPARSNATESNRSYKSPLANSHFDGIIGDKFW